LKADFRAAYMPDAAWAVSVHPQACPGRRVSPAQSQNVTPSAAVLEQLASLKFDRP
jgi:hypothetical protein